MRKINNYSELCLEKERLEHEAKNQKQNIKAEMNSVKHLFDPVIHTVSLIKKVVGKIKSAGDFFKGEKQNK